MNKKIENIRKVIMYFLKRAEEEHFSAGMVRITKLLYLLDVEYYRDNGSIFTGFNWIYYKYAHTRQRSKMCYLKSELNLKRRLFLLRKA